MIAFLLALVGAAGTGGGGYLLGRQLRKKRVQEAEHQLEATQQHLASVQQALSASQTHGARLSAALDEQRRTSGSVTRVADEVRALIDPLVGAQRASAARLQAQMQQISLRVDRGEDSGERLAALRSELHKALVPLLQQDRDTQSVRKLVVDVLGPLMEKERRAQGLTSLNARGGGRHQLPGLLDMLARRGGFAAVILSDAMGLPLAASAGARDADVLAGVSSLVLTLADRVVGAGGPPPLAMVVRDTAGQRVLHRIFSVERERYLLTAVAKGTEVSSDALDPALGALEASLSATAA